MTEQMTIQQAIELAIQHQQSGRLQEAQSIYRQILVAQPNQPDALHLLGVAEYQAGQPEAGLELIRKAIEANPNAPAFYNNLGQILHMCSRVDEAADAFRKALALEPSNAAACNNLGNCLHAKGSREEAMAAYKQAVTLKTDFPEAYYNLGVLLREMGQTEQAVSAFRQALILSPQYPEAWNNLGVVLREQGELDDAIAALRHAAVQRPDFADAYYNLGNALHLKGQVNDAIAMYRQALVFQPNFPAAMNDLGHSLHTLGQFDDAMAAYRQAIMLAPEFPEAHNNLGLTLLLRGEYLPGFAEHEWRWKVRQFGLKNREFNQPLWDGSDLDGKRILLHAEQGFGDTIQFARYAPLVAERGGQVIIEAQSELVRLLQSIQGLDKVIATGQEPGEFDLHAPLISLPAIFQTTLEGIPAKIPYLSVDEELSVRWQERLPTDGLKVGLVWAGRSSHRNDGNRSIPSNALSPLAKVDGVKFISLQKHDAGDEAPKPPRGLNLTDWSADLNDFADTAALVQNLDLVITADTAAAHLAGALGKPVWVLLPFIPDWRWMLARSDSPWYPSMRLFRQTTPGAWDAPIDQVVQELRKLAGE